jgi:hypothetical protein
VIGLDGSTPAVGVAITAEAGAPPTPEALAAPLPAGPATVTTTDREGRFEVEGVDAGTWRVRARGAGGAEVEALLPVFAEAGPEAADSAPWARLALAAPPTPAPLRVRVSGPDGRPVPGAHVRLSEDDGGPPRVATADGAGIAELATGLTGGGTLEAFHEGRVAWRRIANAPRLRNAAVGHRSRPRRAPLRHGAGRLRHRPQGWVQAWRWAAFWTGPPVRGMRVETTTDASGAYAFDDLATGVHVLLVHGAGLALSDAPGRNDGGLRWVSVRAGAGGPHAAGRAGHDLGAGARRDGHASSPDVELGLPYGPPAPRAGEEGGTPVWEVASPWPTTAEYPGRRRSRPTPRGAIDSTACRRPPRGASSSAPGRAFDARAQVGVAAGRRSP